MSETGPKKERNLIKQIADFLTNVFTRFTILLRIGWLLFPAIFFVFLTYQCFWHLGQGQDVLNATLEKVERGEKRIGWIILIAMMFWILVTWYSSRILIYRKPSLYHGSKTIGFHGPRLLGFLGWSVIWIALLRVPVAADVGLPSIKPENGRWYLLGSAIAYFFLYYLLKWIRDRLILPETKKKMVDKTNAPAELDQPTGEEKKEQRVFNLICIAIGVVVICILILNYVFSGALLLFCSIILIQLFYLFLIIIRRGRLPYKDLPLEMDSKVWMQQWKSRKGKAVPGFLGNVLYHANISPREEGFFYVFNFFSVVALFYYIKGIVDLYYANYVTTLPLVLLAFGVLVGFFALISMFSLVKNINFHFILFVLIFFMGKTNEPHYAQIVDAEKPNTDIANNRPDLRTYFLSWALQWKDSIAKSNEYPVLFVLADGGASRSGYWAASALGRLEDSTNRKFSQHLFCLSGTSGGGVGHGVFLSLLHNKTEMQGRGYEEEAKKYLKNDFLSFTLARMLGPDIFRLIIPGNIRSIKDRAGALETAMEQLPKSPLFMKTKMSVTFSSLLPLNNNSVRLPVFCINTTRMQDGRPGVISNISIKDRDTSFGPRLDVLDYIKKGKDMKLSTAVVMGARFPYISPAGRIDESILLKDTVNGEKDSVQVHYFVDGGYFDNSGAGIVHEMILELQEIIKSLNRDTSNNNFRFTRKLKFYVIHITNSPLVDPKIKKVNSLKNDVMAPLITLVGAYSTQTDVNDSRLKKHLQITYDTRSDSQYYKRIDLYKGINPETLNFPMNWSISEYYSRKMDSLLSVSWQHKNLIRWIRDSL